jgi:TetR/AcrR family transcriptional regulator, tetracycline repressor protein
MARKRLAEREAFSDCEAWMKAAPTRPVIDRSNLLREAVALLDEAGLDGLTMRRLAERLGVQAPSLYNHVRDKNELVALLADTLSAEITTPPVDQPWRARIEHIAHEFRRVLLAHRDAALVFAMSPPSGPNRTRLIEYVLNTVVDAGFAKENACNAAYAMHTFVMGFAFEEGLGSARDRDGLPAVADATRRSSLPPERFPTMCALSAEWCAFDSQKAFDFALGMLMDGFAAHLAPKPKTKDAAKVH